jgi:hypothetical protein
VSERDLDAEFERIIAGWDDEAPDPQLRAEAGPLGPSTDVTSTLGETDPTEPPSADRDAGEGDAEVGRSPAGSPTSGPTGSAGGTAAGSAQAVGADPVGTEPGRPDPTARQLGADPASPTSPPGQSGGVLGLPIAPTTSHVWRGSEGQRDDVDDLLDAVEPDDDHFVPPSEIELPSAETDPMYWAIVMGLVGGPLLLLYLLLFDRDGSGWWIVTGLAMLVVGFVLLVLRGGTERDPFDDGTRV